MKKLILVAAGLVFVTVLSAQTESKSATTTTTTTTTTNTGAQKNTTVTKSTPVLKKKLVVIDSKKLNERSGAIQEDNTKSKGKKEEDPSINTQDDKNK